MQIVNGDNLHEMLKLVFWEKNENTIDSRYLEVHFLARRDYDPGELMLSPRRWRRVCRRPR